MYSVPCIGPVDLMKPGDDSVYIRFLSTRCSVLFSFAFLFFLLIFSSLSVFAFFLFVLCYRVQRVSLVLLVLKVLLVTREIVDFEVLLVLLA